MKYVLGLFVILVLFNMVNNAMKTPEEKEMERYEAATKRAQAFHNANRAIASESTCTVEQEFRNPDMCNELANERTEELDKRSSIYSR